ncbi:MAG: cysteine rich repeat-containing protein [Rhizobiaceae bacterium]
MKSLIEGISLFAVLLLAGTFLSVQSSHAQGVLEACEEEIEVLCPKVSPGNGRTISCLYAHENYLNEPCAMAIVDMGDMLDFVFTTVRSAVAVCASDIESKCAGTKFGEGRILTCLRENSADINPECSKMVENFGKELAAE